MIRLENPFDPHSSLYKFYPSSGQSGALPSAVLYKLSYDLHNNEIWVATAKGLAVLTDLDATNSFTVYDAEELGGDEIWTIYSDGKIYYGLLLWEEESIK